MHPGMSVHPGMSNTGEEKSNTEKSSFIIWIS